MTSFDRLRVVVIGLLCLNEKIVNIENSAIEWEESGVCQKLLYKYNSVLSLLQTTMSKIQNNKIKTQVDDVVDNLFVELNDEDELQVIRGGASYNPSTIDYDVSLVILSSPIAINDGTIQI